MELLQTKAIPFVSSGEQSILISMLTEPQNASQTAAIPIDEKQLDDPGQRFNRAWNFYQSFVASPLQ